jgi:hypothetical protein
MYLPFTNRLTTTDLVTRNVSSSVRFLNGKKFPELIYDVHLVGRFEVLPILEYQDPLSKNVKTWLKFHHEAVSFVVWREHYMLWSKHSFRAQDNCSNKILYNLQNSTLLFRCNTIHGTSPLNLIQVCRVCLPGQRSQGCSHSFPYLVRRRPVGAS